MAVVLSVASRQYSPRTITLSPSFAAGGTARVTLTRESWPAGDVGNMAIKSPEGDLLASVSFQGGDATNRDGTPRTVQSFELAGLAAGQYSVEVTILQTLRTAVTVERL